MKDYIQTILKSMGKVIGIPFVFMLGAIAIAIGLTIGYAAYWIVFPCVYIIGGYVGNNLFHFDLSPMPDSPLRWFLGAVCVAFPFVSYAIGMEILHKIRSSWNHLEPKPSIRIDRGTSGGPPGAYDDHDLNRR